LERQAVGDENGGRCAGAFIVSDRTWKANERAIARRLGGQRVGNRGSNTEDVAHPWLSIEVKSRRVLPAWLVAAVAQARRNASAGRLPLVVLHQVGRRHDDDLVLLTLADFEAWFGGLAVEAE